MLKTWEQARFSAFVESDPRPNLIVLAAPGLWESVDPNWIKLFLSHQPDIRLRLETAYSPQIFQRLQQGTADLALLMEPHARNDMRALKVGEIELTMVSDSADQAVESVIKNGYIHVDWSTSFNTQFFEFFPDYLQADITVSTAKIAADLMVDFPGSAYLSQHLTEKISPLVKLHPVLRAPQFRVPIFANYASASTKTELIENALNCFEFG